MRHESRPDSKIQEFYDLRRTSRTGGVPTTSARKRRTQIDCQKLLHANKPGWLDYLKREWPQKMPPLSLIIPLNAPFLGPCVHYTCFYVSSGTGSDNWR